ncbi:hypothetical protein EG329_014396 [Mollisiaceae sp. DMI_Dod_QoI]|nr:hypothetical protein EG329_014396 [Helotiales sp. DMI_Dod_QoI]
MALYAATFLGTMLVWGRLDSSIASNFASKYKPAPIAENPTFTPEEDVSVLVNTLNPPPAFKACLVRWYENNPLEIVITTTKTHFGDVLSIVNRAISENGLDPTRFIVITSEKGARVQFKAGIEKAKGNIIAKVDDHIFWSRKYLNHMLAALEDPKVGGVAPPIKVYIPEDRRSRDQITPWEVAATKLAHRGPGSATSMHVAAKWCWILAGVTGVFRAKILKDPEFLQGYTNDTWRGAKLDVGEDTFVSRWLLKKDWIIATQWCDETRVWRTVKRTPAFINQILRWERSTIQSFVRTTYEVPQMWKNPYVARKTLERIFKAPLGVMHVLAWIICFRSYPISTLLLAAYYVHGMVPGYHKFFTEYPYMAKYWWAAVLLDFSYVVVGPWAWLTLSDTTWERGEGKFEGQSKEGNKRVDGKPAL